MCKRLLIPGPAMLLVALVALPAALSLHESYDLFFSLATGRWLLEHGFPATDPFSLTASQPWPPHEWAYCVVVAWAERLLGGQGPGWLAGLILALELWLLVRLLRQAQGPRVGLGLLALLLVIGAQGYALTAERAYHVGHLAFVCGLLLVQRMRQGADWPALAFIPVVALWANFHGSWIAGPALLGSAALGLALERGRIDRRIVKLVACASGAWLAAALSPEGLQTCLYPLGFLGSHGSYSVAEWHPWSLGTGCGKALAILSLLAVFSLARARRLFWSLLLPAAGLLLVTVPIERFSPLTAMVLALVWLEHAGFAPAVESRIPARAQSRLSAPLRGWSRVSSGWLWLWLALAVAAGGLLERPASLLERMDRRYLPVQALEALLEQPPGKVLNTYRFGGAISAVAGPEYKVFIDGRADPFPMSVHTDYRKLALLEPGWREVLENYDPDYLLWSGQLHGAGLIAALEWLGGWEELAGDAVGGLWRRMRVGPP